MSLEWEAMQRGERPLAKGYTVGHSVNSGEETEVVFFGEPDSDKAVSCLSPKYHNGREAERQSIDDEIQWHLPGWGKSKDDCGDYLLTVGCRSFGQPVLDGAMHDRKVVLKHCHRPECPICYVPWAVREGTVAADRMTQAERAYRMVNMPLGDARHFTFSPPQDGAKELMKTKDGFKRLKSKAIALIKKSGLKGGAIIFHSHRVNKAKQLYLSPHFHVVGYGYIEETKAFYKASDGWIYKNMGKRASLAGTIIYALDHCGLGYENGSRIGHALTWFGVLSYNKLEKESSKSEERIVTCRACNEPLIEYEFKDVVGSDGITRRMPDWDNPKRDRDGDYVPFKIRVKTIVYRIRPAIKGYQKTGEKSI